MAQLKIIMGPSSFIISVSDFSHDCCLLDRKALSHLPLAVFRALMLKSTRDQGYTSFLFYFESQIPHHQSTLMVIGSEIHKLAPHPKLFAVGCLVL